MKMIPLLITSALVGLVCCNPPAQAQQPFLEYAMINSCGTEGANEFFVINTGASPVDVQRIRFEYSQVSLGAADPIVDGRTANIWVAAPTGSGTLVSSCGLTPLVTGIVPANSRILVIPSVFQTSYNVSNFCTGGNLYVLYFNTTLASSWTTTTTGNFANTAADPLNIDRFLRILSYDGSNTLISQDERFYLPNSLTIFQGSAEGAGVRWITNPDNSITPQYLNTGCVNAVLPLRVISFSGFIRDEHASFSVELSENDFTYDCSLEKSDDGRNFYTVRQLPVSPSSQQTRLQFIDPAVFVKNAWYRLKLNTAGRLVYSNILFIRKEINSIPAFTIFYSEANTATASLYADEKQEITFRVMNTNGQLLWTRQIQVEKGWNTTLLQTPGNANSLLIIQVTGKTFTATKKIWSR